MIRILSFCLLVLIMISAKSQDIIKDSIIVDGLYKDYTSFRKNRPSIKGNIEFVQKKNGSIKTILIDGDSIPNKELIKDYWGFSKNNIVYFNASKAWSSLGEDRILATAFSPIIDKGYYFVSVVHTIENSGTGAIMIGSMIGGIAGGLIVGAMVGLSNQYKNGEYPTSLDDPSNRIIVINHQTGQPKLADVNSLPYLIGSDKEIRNELKSVNDELKLSKIKKAFKLKFVYEIIDKFNEKNSDSLIFNEKEFWPEVTLVRKAKKQASESIRVYSGDNYLGELTNQTFVKEKVAPGHDTKLRFETIVDGDTIQSIQQLNLFQKEKKYFIVSHNIKSPSNIDIDESDATRTKYAIQALRK